MNNLLKLAKNVLISLTAVFFAAAQAYGNEIVIAQVAPFSGPVAPYSQLTHLGASVYFESINAAGGIKGSKIKFVTRDDKLDPKLTVSLYEEVARVEKPVAFLYPIGPVGVSALIQQDIPQKLAIPVVGTIPALHKLRNPMKPYTFHVGIGDDAELVNIVKHMATLGLRKIGVVHWDEPSAHEAIAIIEAEARKNKVEVTVKAPVEPGTIKVEPALVTIAQASPAAIIAILPVNATAAFVKALREAKNGTLVYGPSYTESTLLAKLAGSNNARGVGISQVVPNPFFAATPLMREYQQNLKKYGPKDAEISSLSFEGYIGAKILVEGIRRAGKTINGETVKAGLEKLNRVDLGGLVMSYDVRDHVALEFQDFSVVGNNGRLLY